VARFPEDKIWFRKNLVADMSRAFPTSSRGACGRMPSVAAGCGELKLTGQWFNGQVAEIIAVLEPA
jgi:hypothetical protein